jgi:type VI protein secretion system component VasK
MMNVARKFAATVLPGVIKPLRVLWNEIIAFIFFVLAAVSIPAAWRSYQSYQGDAESLMRLTLTGFFGLVMLCYGIYSLVRARKIGKQ